MALSETNLLGERWDKMHITLGSLFDGSGGFPLAGALHGITPLWASEIEPYPLRVTAARFPGMTQLGDVKDIDGALIEPVDIVTFGSPCQDLSVAGKQAGIRDGKRSSLFFEAIRIIREMRRATNGEYPRFAVWENVPGAFSSNKGEDFRAVLQALCGGDVLIPEPPKGKWKNAGCVVGDGFSVAWRVYDAQYWGVPQRRKRIYLVADFRSERAGEILFEREGVRGDTPPGAEAREETAANAEGGAGRGHHSGCLNPWDSQARRLYSVDNIFPTLQARDRVGQNHQGVCYAVTFDCRGNGNGLIGPTLTGDHQNRVTDYTSVICMASGQTNAEIMGGTSTTLMAGHEHPIIVHNSKTPRKYLTRRLIPLECCRLMGFPDWWEDGVDGSDSARYKMWGNGIALPCAADVMGRIAKELLYKWKN